VRTGRNTLSRREFIRNAGAAVAGGAAALAGPSASAQDLRARHAVSLEDYDVIIPRVRFECRRPATGPWNIYPGADRNLLAAFTEAVRCKVQLCDGCRDDQPPLGRDRHFNAVVDFESAEPLRQYPFVFMTGENYFDFSDRCRQNLKRYIEEGGFLLIDDCCLNCTGDILYQRAFRILQEVFGRDAVRRIPINHEVFHNLYDFPAGLPYIQGQDHGAHGVFVGDRLAVFLCATDIHCGWADRRHRMFGRSQAYFDSLKIGMNILLYALSH